MNWLSIKRDHVRPMVCHGHSRHGNGAKYQTSRLHHLRHLRLEHLEDRNLLSVSPSWTPTVSSSWFQDLTVDAGASDASRTLASAMSSAPPTDSATTGDDAGSGKSTGAVANQWIVQLTPEAAHLAGSVAGVTNVLATSAIDAQVVRGLGMVGMVLLETGQDSSFEAIGNWLSSQSVVASFEPNAILTTSVLPNDTSFSQLWGMNNTRQTGGTMDADIDAPEAWEFTKGSSSIVVGVIDTGVDYTHSDLAANIWTNPGEIADNGIDDDHNGFVDDIHGYDFVNNDGDPRDDHSHGTHVAGTIAAVGDNGLGVAGVNWSSSIMALKFLDSGGNGTTDNAVRALNYASMMRTSYGVNICVTNNSWGGGSSSSALYNAIAANRDAGMLFIAAAGNDGTNNDSIPHYPSSYALDNIIAVAATDHNDNLASFSCYGASSVDLAAPGANVYSTVPGNSYATYSGTSMATPHVTGAAALAWSLVPTATAAQIRSALLASADPKASLAGKMATGGRLNALSTLNQLGLSVVGTNPADDSTVSTSPTDFVVNFSSPYLSSSIAASDFAVNGIAASSFTLTDLDTVTFHYASSPVTTQGLQNMSIAAGSILRASDSNPITPWNASFRYDAHVISVASTNPPNGAAVGLPISHLDLNFDEAVDGGSIGPGDLTLSQGSIVSASLLDSDTVRYTLTGISTEGTLNVSLGAGAVADVWGNPGAAYSGSFTTDIAAVAFPTPLTAATPLGSLIYSGSTSGTIAPAGDTDSFTIELDAGQTLTALVDPAATLRPMVSIASPDGASLGTATAPAADEKAVLQTVVARMAGTYTVTVGSLGGTSGTFSLQLTLNAALEAEEHGGAINDTLATAQDLNGSFLALGEGTAQRGAVVGTLAGLGTGTKWTIPASSRVDAIPDSLRGLEYITTSSGDVLRYDLSTGAFLTPFHLGGSLKGADISPDQNTLVVADSTFGTGNNWIYVVDLTTSINHKITFPLASYEGGTFSVAFIDNNTVLVSSSFQGSGWVPLRKVDLSTGVATTLSTVRQNSMLSASADHSVVAYEESNISSGEFGRYRVSDRTFIESGTGWFGFEIAASRNGMQYAVPTYNGTYIYNQDLQQIGRIGTYANEMPIGVAYSPTFDRVYFAWADFDHGHACIDAYDTNTLSQAATIDSGASFSWGGNAAFQQGRLRIAANGALLSSTVSGGVNVYAIGPTTAAEDWYKFNMVNGESATVGIDVSGTSSVTLELYDDHSRLLATGVTAANLNKVISDFQATVTSTYYIRVLGSNAQYRLLVTRNGSYDTECNDSQATSQRLALENGQGTVLGYLEPSVAVAVGVEPDNYAAGTTLTNVVSGINLTVQGATATVTSQTASYHSTGTRVFAQGSVTTWTSSTVLKATFDALVSSVSIDLVPDDSNDPGFLKAYNSAGVLLEDVETNAPPYPGFLTMTITRPTADIAYVVAGGQSSQAVYLDRLVVSAGTSGGGDYYRMFANPGDPLVITTATPGGGLGELVNTLDPKIQLYDPSGAMVAFDDDSGSDGRNAKLTYVAAIAGDYVVRVLSDSRGTGEYVLMVNASQLALTIPPDVAENAGTISGTLGLSAPSTGDVVVNLVSGSPARMTVPASITIPAGATSAPLPINIIDDALLQGPEKLAITATAIGCGSGVAIFTLHDDETAALSVSLPASATEGDGVLTAVGVITASVAPVRDVVIHLTSSDTTEVTVPATAILRAGQLSATFDATIVDDGLIDDTRAATITAQVDNWTDGSASITVLDNDRTLSVTLPTDAWEGQGALAGAGKVTIGGALPTDLTVSLTSSDVSEFVLPATVVIPAGQTSVAFDLTIGDDADRDGAQTATVTASNAGFTDSTRSIVIRDNEVDRFVWDAISSPQTAGVAFSVRVRATNVDDETILVYVDTAAIGATGNSGVLSVTPAACAFASGVWAGSLAVNAVDTNVVLTVDDGGGRPGSSNAFDVTHGLLDHFQWSTIPSPQYENVPFAATLTAKDAHGYTVADFNGAVSLSGAVASGTASSIVISEIDVGALDRIEFTNVSGTSLDIGGWKVLVYDTNYRSTPQHALTIPVGTVCPAGGVFVLEESGTNPGAYPHFYSGINLNWAPAGVTGVLLVDMAGNARDFAAASALDPSTITDPVTIVPSQWQGAQAAAVSGESYSYQRVGNKDNGNAGDWVINLAPTIGTRNTGLTVPFVGSAVAITPTTAAFTGGVWSGTVTVLQTATNLRLHMDDGAGHAHDSNTFNVLPPSLLATISADATEGDDTVLGTISIPATLANDLLVQLVSSDTSRVTVPITVTIPSGQLSAPLPITIVDNAELDGLQNVTITATAVNYVSDVRAINIHDNETAVLVITLPSTVREGDSTLAALGTITSNAAPTRDITIALLSSDTSEITVPATLVLRAGQTSVVFDVTVGDDAVIDGGQIAVITAHVENWTDGTSKVEVLDNDRWLSVTLPTNAWEGQGALSRAGTVTIGGTLSSDLTVSLASSDAGELVLPATVTIPAGKTFAVFDATIVDDSDRDGGQTAAVTASSAEFADATTATIIHDNEVDRFSWNTIDGPQTAGVAFSTTVRATNVDNETIPVFGGTAALAATGDSGVLAVTPANCTFASGVWTGSLAVNAVDTNVVLTVDDGGGRPGSSNAFDVTHGPLAAFEWNSISSPQYEDAPFVVALTAVDANGYTVTNYNGTAKIEGSIGSSTSGTILSSPTATWNGNNGSFTLGYSFTPNTNLLVTSVRHYFGSKISVWTDNGMLVGSQTFAATGPGWADTPVTTPFQLQAGVTYRVAAYSAGQRYYGIPSGWSHTSPLGTIGVEYESMGDAFPTRNSNSYLWFVDIVATVGTFTSVPITPTEVTFIDGVWSGGVTASDTATGMRLGVNDGFGHFGDSNTFDVLPLTLTMTIPSDATEGDGTATGTISLPAALASDLLVHLASSDSSRATVPATLTIPAGQLSVPLPITIVDNALLDGVEQVIISAALTGPVIAEAVLTVHDNETAVLTVTLPASAMEGDGVLTAAGVITASVAPVRDVAIELISSDTGEIALPSTVVLRAGQTSVAFDIAVVDDTLIDGTQTVAVTARAENWIDGVASMQVLDADRTLTVSLPVDAWEGQGTLAGAGKVTIGGALPTDLTVSLTSSDVSEFVLPATVVIPAGQTSVAFDLTIVDDGDRDGAQTATVTASNAGFTDSTRSIVIRDNEVDRFVWDAISSPQTAGVAFSVRVRATNVDDETILVYVDTAAIGATGNSGVLSVTPAACAFASGVWAGSLAVNAVDTNVVLTVDDGGGRPGSSNAFDVTHGLLDHFQWSTIVSPQYEDVPFAATLTAKDAHGYTITDYNGTVNLSGLVGTGVGSAIIISECNEDSPDYVEITNVSSTTVNTSGWVVAVNDAEQRDINSVHDVVWHLPSSMPPRQTLYRTDDPGDNYWGSNIWWGSATMRGWAIILDNNGDVVDFTVWGYSASEITSMNVNIAGHNVVIGSEWIGASVPFGGSSTRSLQRHGNSDNNDGNDFSWVASSKGALNPGLTLPFPGGVAFVDVSPTSVTFVNGVWSGNVTASQTADFMYLHADDGARHVSDSNTFDVHAIALDFGDAPASYSTLLADDGARHALVSGFYLGGAIDADPDGQPNADATGDDVHGTPNDEDGIVFGTPLYAGENAIVQVTASVAGKLDAWIDFNDDGDWADAGEKVFNDVSLTAGVNSLTLTVPATATLTSQTYARFRFSSAGGLSYTGMAPDGEVEDYQVAIQMAPPVLDPEPAVSPGTENTITWSLVPGADQYYAVCDDNSDFSSPEQNSGWINDTQHTFTGLLDGVHYYYRVEAGKTIAGPAVSWTQTSQADFSSDTLTNTSATSHSGDVVLMSTSTMFFSDDFEDGDYNGWVNGSGSYTRQVTDATAAAGAYSFTQVGGASGHYTGVSHPLANITPDRIDFSVCSANAATSGGYFVVGTGPANSSTAVFFYMKSDGTMGIYNDLAWYSTPYVANKWYNVSVTFDWSAKTVDYSVDGVLIASNVRFRSTSVTNLSQVYLYNFDYTQSWWDEIRIVGGTDGYVPSGSVVSTPITLSSSELWGTLAFNGVTPTGTSLTIDVLPATGSTPIPGYSNVASGTSLAGISDSTIRLRANLETADAAATPALHDWSVTWQEPDTRVVSGWSNVESSTQGTPPTVTSSTPSTAGPTSTDSLTFTVVFGKPVWNVTTDDFQLTTTGTATGAVAGIDASNGTSFTVTVNTLWGDGTLRLDLKGGTDVRDAAGNIATAYMSGSTVTLIYATLHNQMLFYKGSRYSDVARGYTNDDAIATDKTALMPGESASAAAYTSYSRGINGIMVDIAGLYGRTLTAGDFEFRFGNSAAPPTWDIVAAPATIAAPRAIVDLEGGQRVEITWPNGTLTNGWLQVTVKASPNTGLATPEVFYFGNAVGDTCNQSAAAMVNSADVGRIRQNSGTANVPITNVFDVNRDGSITSADVVLSQRNSGFKLYWLVPPAVLPARDGEDSDLTADTKLSTNKGGAAGTTTIEATNLAAAAANLTVSTPEDVSSRVVAAAHLPIPLPEIAEVVTVSQIATGVPITVTNLPYLGLGVAFPNTTVGLAAATNPGWFVDLPSTVDEKGVESGSTTGFQDGELTEVDRINLLSVALLELPTSSNLDKVMVPAERLMSKPQAETSSPSKAAEVDAVLRSNWDLGLTVNLLDDGR